jgi:ribose transport system permease protein
MTGIALRAKLGPRNISAIYVFVLIFVIFATWIPNTFLTASTWRTLLDSQAITGLATIAIVIPLAAGVFNLAVGLQVGAASMLVGWLLVNAGLPISAAVALTALAGMSIGFVSGLLIVKARIDSFIATLGVSSLLSGLVAAISDGQQILGVPEGFAFVGTGQLAGITYPVLLMLLVALLAWYVLERTPTGRRLYATGGNLETARLAGVRTSLVVIGSLVACGLISSIAGMLLTAQLANADPTIGPGYLLPAFTAAFLGSTQFRGGRFNIWGAILALYVLAAGVKGLQLVGAPVWIPDVFNGASLLIAVAMAKFQGNTGRTSAIRRLLRLGQISARQSDNGR